MRAGPANSIGRRFARAATWSALGGVLSRAGGLVANVVAARALGAAEYGKLALLTSTCLIVTSFAGLGLALAATKHVAQFRDRDPSRTGDVIRTCTVGTLLGGGITGCALLAMSASVAGTVFRTPELTVPLRYVALWIPLAAFGQTQNGIFAGLESFRSLALWSGAKGLGGAICFVGGALLAGVHGALVGSIVAEAAGILSGSWILGRERARCGIAPGRSWGSHALPVLRFGMATMLGSAAIVPAFWLPRVWLARSTVAGFDELGLFDAAAKWALAIGLLPAFICSAQLPISTQLLAARSEREYRRLRSVNLTLVTIACLVPGIALAGAAGPIMALSGAEYRAGAPVLIVLALSAVAVGLNTALGQNLVSRGLIRVRLLGDWFLAGLMLASAFVLVPLRGAMGLALAHALSYCATTLALFLAEYWNSRTPSSDVPSRMRSGRDLRQAGGVPRDPPA